MTTTTVTLNGEPRYAATDVDPERTFEVAGELFDGACRAEMNRRDGACNTSEVSVYVDGEIELNLDAASGDHLDGVGAFRLGGREYGAREDGGRL
jgi:hypothetical protein